MNREELSKERYYSLLDDAVDIQFTLGLGPAN